MDINIKVIPLSDVDKVKYRNQKNVRRIRESKGGFEHIVFATDQDL